jgi:hypothetical protein
VKENEKVDNRKVIRGKGTPEDRKSLEIKAKDNNNSEIPRQINGFRGLFVR